MHRRIEINSERERERGNCTADSKARARPTRTEDMKLQIMSPTYGGKDNAESHMMDDKEKDYVMGGTLETLQEVRDNLKKLDNSLLDREVSSRRFYTALQKGAGRKSSNATEEETPQDPVLAITNSVQASVLYFAIAVNLGYILTAIRFSMEHDTDDPYCIGVLVIALHLLWVSAAGLLGNVKARYLVSMELVLHIPLLVLMRLRLGELYQDSNEENISGEKNYLQQHFLRVLSFMLEAPFLQVTSFALMPLAFFTLASAALLTIAIPAGTDTDLVPVKLAFCVFFAVLVCYVNRTVKCQWNMAFEKQNALVESIKKKNKKAEIRNAKSRAMVQHGMKNICASMAATCEIAKEDHTATVASLKADFRYLEGLAQMGVILCNKRAKMAVVLEQNFEVQRNLVDCMKIINSVKRLSMRITVNGTKEDISASPIWAFGDQDIIYFILENALSNALYHGLAEYPIAITVKNSDTELIITVSNWVASGTILQDGFETDTKGEIRHISAIIDPQDSRIAKNTSSHAPQEELTSRDARRRQQSSLTGIAEIKKNLSTKAKVPFSDTTVVGTSTAQFTTRGLSEGLGLRIIKVCCQKAKYKCRFYQKNTRVSFALHLELTKTRIPSSDILTKSDFTESKGYMFKKRDLSMSGSSIDLNKSRSKTSPGIKRRELISKPNIVAGIQTPELETRTLTPEELGSCGTNVQQMKLPLNGSDSGIRYPNRVKRRIGKAEGDEEKECKKRYKICCIEDEKMIRKMYQRILIQKYFHKDSFILGETLGEVQSAVPLILSRKCDGIILDQNLVYPEGSLNGTDLAENLRTLGYTGLIMMRSANTEEEDIKFYLKAGADGVMSKSMNSKTIAEKMTAGIEMRHKKPYVRPRGRIVSQKTSLQQSVRSGSVSPLPVPIRLVEKTANPDDVAV